MALLLGRNITVISYNGRRFKSRSALDEVALWVPHPDAVDEGLVPPLGVAIQPLSGWVLVGVLTANVMKPVYIEAVRSFMHSLHPRSELWCSFAVNRYIYCTCTHHVYSCRQVSCNFETE